MWQTLHTWILLGRCSQPLSGQRFSGVSGDIEFEWRLDHGFHQSASALGWSCAGDERCLVSSRYDARGSSGQKILPLTVWEPFRCYFAYFMLRRLFHEAFSTNDLWSSTRATIGILVTSLDHLTSLAKFGLSCSKLIPLMNYGHHCALVNL